MARTHGLSKSTFMSGLQCHLLLWWRVHEPAAVELAASTSLQFTFDQSTQVGRVAREYVPGGTLIDVPYDDYDGKLEATKAALAGDTPAIYEASVLADNVFVAVDILRRERTGWRIIEVKASTTVKAPHYPDVAVQTHVLQRAGIEVTGTDVMVLNSDCAYPDLTRLFRSEDVGGGVDIELSRVPQLIQEQLAVLKRERPPEVAIGPHCDSPYECPFKSRCWAHVPEHHVSTLYYMKRAAAEFMARGFTTIHDIPEGEDLHPLAERQRRSVIANRMLVEGDLAGALHAFDGRLAFLDFETVAPPIPVWNGCHPYEAVPAQFSCHTEDTRGGLVHHEWLAEGPDDPRPEMADRVIKACRGARAVVAYYAPFEKGCLKRLALALPDRAAELHDIIARLVDLLPTVRDHVYHPDFGGSFSIKTVLPALVPDFTYEGLEIADGNLASQVLLDLMLEGHHKTAVERGQIRASLLRYCERDTMAMVKVLERLRSIARGE